MALFGKNKNSRRGEPASASTPESPQQLETEPEAEIDPKASAPRGPWDAADVEGVGARIDLGSLWVPTILPIGLEVSQGGERPIAVSIATSGITMRLQAFAAPKTSGIWDEIREELAEQARGNGGQVDDIPGPFGRELLAHLPSEGRGKSALQPVRFWGVDGPRWFVRAVLSGPRILDEEASGRMADVFGDTVVVRGPEARAPRELLDLHPPGDEVAGPVGEPASLDPLRRGPEITEVR